MSRYLPAKHRRRCTPFVREKSWFDSDCGLCGRVKRLTLWVHTPATARLDSSRPLPLKPTKTIQRSQNSSQNNAPIVYRKDAGFSRHAVRIRIPLGALGRYVSKDAGITVYAIVVDSLLWSGSSKVEHPVEARKVRVRVPPGPLSECGVVAAHLVRGEGHASAILAIPTTYQGKGSWRATSLGDWRWRVKSSLP